MSPCGFLGIYLLLGTLHSGVALSVACARGECALKVKERSQSVKPLSRGSHVTTTWTHCNERGRPRHHHRHHVRQHPLLSHDPAAAARRGNDLSRRHSDTVPCPIVAGRPETDVAQASECHQVRSPRSADTVLQTTAETAPCSPVPQRAAGARQPPRPRSPCSSWAKGRPCRQRAERRSMGGRMATMVPCTVSVAVAALHVLAM